MPSRQDSTGHTTLRSSDSSPESFHFCMAMSSSWRVTMPLPSSSGPTLVLRSSTMVAPTAKTSPMS